jgi:hypothetical protein
MIATELNYDINDNEILAIVSVFTKWKKYLKRAEYPILIFSDYKNLEYITMIKVLNYY